MYGFNPEKIKAQPKVDGPKLGFKPRSAENTQPHDLPVSTTPGKGFNPKMPVTTDALPGLGFQPHRDAMRAQAQNQAPDSIPAMMKPGEFVLPPDTVQAVGGKKALQGVVDATHTPAPQTAMVPRGFKPEMFFAEGGSTDDEDKRQNSFGDAAAAARDPGVAQVGGAPAQPATSPVTPPLGQMHNPSPRTGAQMLASGLDSGARAFFDSFGPSQTKPAPATPNPTDQRLAAGTQASPAGSQPNAVPGAPAATAAQSASTGNVTRTGNSYSGTDVSGDITINGQQPRNGGQITAQNMAAADNLSARGIAPVLAAANAAPAPGPGLGVAPLGVSAPTVRHSGNSWQAANDLRNARVSASSIMNNGGRWDRHGKGVVSPERAAYLAMLGTDQALKQAQPGMDQEAMRQNAGLQRTGMQEQGANARAMLSSGIDQQRLGMEQTAAGFKTRAAARLEGLQNAYQSAKTDAERGALARQIREIQGTEKGDQWKAVALQGGTDAQGNKTESILGAVNERTGEMRRMEAGPRVPAISENAQAISIRDNPSLTREQKVEALRKLGYS